MKPVIMRNTKNQNIQINSGIYMRITPGNFYVITEPRNEEKAFSVFTVQSIIMEDFFNKTAIYIN